MNAWRAGILAGVGLIGLVAAVQIKSPASAQSDPGWRSDYNTAAAEARTSGKPLLVAFR